MRELLAGAKRPLVIAGGGGWSAAACADLRRFVEANALPVASAFRNQDVFDNTHPNYAGEVGIAMNPKLAARVREADVLLVIGERLGEMVTAGYTLLAAPQPAHALIHVHPDATELGRRLPSDAGDPGIDAGDGGGARRHAAAGGARVAA